MCRVDDSSAPHRLPVYRAGVKPMSFVGGDDGAWRVTEMRVLVGAPLAPIARLDMRTCLAAPGTGRWVLKGVAGHARYVERHERGPLDAASPPLGRSNATAAAFVAMRKSDAWWVLTQEERRAIFEARSHHIARSMKYLPAIARGLYHCRDLGEPFDFLAWFEFAPDHSALFEDLLGELRGTEEWRYVDGEVELRVSR